jgi:hypothetical protein
MASFETIFRIPSSHVLKAKFHSYGAGVPESWSHEEYDGGGEFVARYESCVHTNDDGVRTSDGWKKFDFEDVLVAAEGDLPIRWLRVSGASLTSWYYRHIWTFWPAPLMLLTKPCPDAPYDKEPSHDDDSRATLRAGVHRIYLPAPFDAPPGVEM